MMRCEEKRKQILQKLVKATSDGDVTQLRNAIEDSHPAPATSGFQDFSGTGIRLSGSPLFTGTGIRLSGSPSGQPLLAGAQDGLASAYAWNCNVGYVEGTMLPASEFAGAPDAGCPDAGPDGQYVDAAFRDAATTDAPTAADADAAC